MNYLRLRRSRLILASFVLFAVLISAFPSVDIQISRFFFDGGSFRQQWWQKLLKEHLGYMLAASFATVVSIYVYNRLLKRNLGSVDGRRVVYLLLVMIIGAGLIVNVAFKNNVGRARPRDVAEFGGVKQFTPPFVVSRECATNCSFSSGDAAGAFFALALAKALTRRPRYLVAAIAFGTLVSLARVSAGAHFFSDTVVSFFVMLIVTDVFYYYLFVAQREGDILARAAHFPAYVLAPIAPARVKALVGTQDRTAGLLGRPWTPVPLPPRQDPNER